MTSESKPRIILPRVPETYYGSTLSVENAEKNLKLYIGRHNNVDEMIIEEVKFDQNLNSYEIHTDKAILLAAPLTRIAYSTMHTV